MEKAKPDSGPLDSHPLRPVFTVDAQECIGRYRWGLADADALADLSLHAYLERLSDSSPNLPLTPAIVRSSVRGTYAALLHGSCQQQDDERRRDLGLSELYAYLLALARHKDSAGAEELAWTALSNVYLSIGRCREPRAFYHFARLKLLETLRELRAPHREMPLPLVMPTRSEDGLVADKDCIERLAIELSKLDTKLQQVLLGQLNGMTDEELALRMGEKAGNIAVLRHRARARLRERPSLTDCVQKTKPRRKT